MNTMEPVGWDFCFVGLSLMLAQCDFARGRSCESSQVFFSERSFSELTHCLLFLGVCFLTWSWEIPQMRRVTHACPAVVGHSKLSQDGTSGCLSVFLLCQSLRISHGHEVFKCLNA